MHIFMKSIEQRYSKILNDHYAEAINLLINNTHILPYCQTELIPLMNLVVDIASLSSNSDRDFLNKKFLDWTFSLKPYNEKTRNGIDKKILSNIYNERMELYGKIINNRLSPRCEWCPTTLPDSIKENPITHCCVAFFDIITNPSCALNYYTGSKTLIDFHYSISLMTVYQKFAELMVSLHNSVYELMK